MKSISILITVVLSIININAQTIPINYIAGIGQRCVVNADGMPVQSGIVMLGVFSGIPNYRLNGFSQLNRTSIRSIFGQPGRFAASFQCNPIDSKLFLVIISGDQIGIFSAADWYMPENDSILTGMQLTTDQLHESYYGSIGADYVSLAPRFGNPIAIPQVKAKVVIIRKPGLRIWN
jgi:hypothetical protein